MFISALFVQIRKKPTKSDGFLSKKNLKVWKANEPITEHFGENAHNGYIGGNRMTKSEIFQAFRKIGLGPIRRFFAFYFGLRGEPWEYTFVKVSNAEGEKRYFLCRIEDPIY
jgi:hypothetical protein